MTVTGFTMFHVFLDVSRLKSSIERTYDLMNLGTSTSWSLMRRDKSLGLLAIAARTWTPPAKASCERPGSEDL